jgi:hypothetical protein
VCLNVRHVFEPKIDSVSWTVSRTCFLVGRDGMHESNNQDDSTILLLL